ncbi:hypothetical protein BZG04_11105 [Salinivibrio kushneri]|uniref:DUF3304 domain-containing protein n=1 Tax=Salinivibrio kushneri TaxID=1908198 RepID=A0AB36K7Y9_9GAMM|nr:hypothetical protein [Salinivibrio kushneri]OOE34672.1 hypothetical protein BZG04_11105 [Salinivibrio kushneri]OOE44957.1 hypothetical protein BZG09_05725 [Salinivibrio kushneri]
MTKWKAFLLLLLSVAVLGCEPEPYTVEAGFTNGSTTGRHIVSKMTITTLSGGKANFAMGSVGGYPGAHSGGGKIDAPAYIEGEWAKGNPEPSSGLISYHRISAPIPDNAEAKMKTMDNYYQNFDRDYGSMEVIVDGPRVRVFYSKSCVDMYDDCAPKQGADPNGWVVRSPKNQTDVVVLFDGKGESSPTPFPSADTATSEHLQKANSPE